MPATKAQTYANHARFDPAFHFFILPLLLLNIIFSIIHAYRHPTYFNIWFVVLSIGLFVTAGLVRSYPLKAQDRIIFLEDRFAADEEAPELVKRALDEHLTRKQIKQAINNWRPDHWRI